MPPLVAIVTIFAIRFPKLAILLSPLAIVGGYYLVTNAIATEAYSWSTRVEAWLIVTEIVKVNPIQARQDQSAQQKRAISGDGGQPLLHKFPLCLFVQKASRALCAAQQQMLAVGRVS